MATAMLPRWRGAPPRGLVPMGLVHLLLLVTRGLDPHALVSYLGPYTPVSQHGYR
jgi:hypothetical protein